MRSFYFRFEDEEENFVSLRKRRHFKNSQVVVKNVPIGHAISQAKRDDVDKLLKKMFDENWAVGEPLINKRLKWYKNNLFNAPVVEEEVEDDECDCLANERCDLHV